LRHLLRNGLSTDGLGDAPALSALVHRGSVGGDDHLRLRRAARRFICLDILYFPCELAQFPANADIQHPVHGSFGIKANPLRL